MLWKVYQVTFSLLSPLHIGYRKISYLQQTRSYIPGRVLWGSLTARLTREQQVIEENSYLEMGKQVDQQIFFSYFYPTTKPEEITLWPWQDEEKFTWLYLNSYCSSALREDKTVQKGMYHETEYIAPYTREGEPVYLLGYIIEKDSCTLSNWKEVLGKIQFGGEQSGGWGKIKLMFCRKWDNTIFNRYLLLDEKGKPQIKVPKGMNILAHANADDEVFQTGDIEPFLGRETRSIKGFGAELSRVEISWIPGSKVKEETVFEIKEKGLWEKHPNF